MRSCYHAYLVASSIRFRVRFQNWTRMAGNVYINGGIWRESNSAFEFSWCSKPGWVSEEEGENRMQSRSRYDRDSAQEHMEWFASSITQHSCRVLSCLCYSRRVCPSSPRGSPPSTITLEERYVWITRGDQECRDSAGVWKVCCLFIGAAAFWEHTLS